MAKKLQLSIAEPCHENWELMTPVEKGKYCGSCQKEVVDFSKMSDRLVAEFFKKPSTGSVCGRFVSDQLNRDIDIPKKRIPWLKYFFSIMLPAFFISKASAQQKIGKVKPVDKDTTRRHINDDMPTLGLVAPNIIPVCKDTADNRLTIKGEIQPVVQKVTRVVVNGKVVNENGEAIPNASVKIMNSGKIIMADEFGKFSFHTTKDQLIELELSSVGYENEHYLYPFTLNYSGIVDVNIQMKAATKEMPEVICYIAGGIKAEFVDTAIVIPPAIKKDTVVINEIRYPIDETKILVYPNPVIPGSSINISFKNLEEGYYMMQILAVSGQLVSQKELWIDKEARVMSMEAPRVTTGTYFMVLVNKKTGKKWAEKLIIE